MLELLASPLRRSCSVGAESRLEMTKPKKSAFSVQPVSEAAATCCTCDTGGGGGLVGLVLVVAS